MAAKVYYLSTCNTCKRILDELEPAKLEKQDIKTAPITAEQLDSLAGMACGYAPLFSRVARKYRSLGLHEQELTEEDYRQYLLDEYTFLKRPVFIIDNEIYIGNSKKNVAAVKEALGL